MSFVHPAEQLPKISAIMPTHNQDKTLVEAIDSILPNVNTLIVVNDGSDDNTHELMHEYFAKFHSNQIIYIMVTQRSGTAHAINLGAMTLHCHGLEGDWMTWVSSDNEYLPEWRETLLKPTAGGGVGAVYSGFQIIKRGVQPRKNAWGRYMFHPHERDKLLSTENCYYGPGFLIRPDVWVMAGGHRGCLSHDYDHWSRVEEACWDMDLEIVGVDKSTVRYFRGPDTAVKRGLMPYDAPHWREVALKRREVE